MKLHASTNRLARREAKDLTDRNRSLSLDRAFLDLPTAEISLPRTVQAVSALTMIDISEAYLSAQNTRADFEDFRRVLPTEKAFWL